MVTTDLGAIFAQTTVSVRIGPNFVTNIICGRFDENHWSFFDISYGFCATGKIKWPPASHYISLGTKVTCDFAVTMSEKLFFVQMLPKSIFNIIYARFDEIR